KVREAAVWLAPRVMVPAAPTPGLPPKIAASPLAQVVLAVPPLVVQLLVLVFQVPAPLSICPLPLPAESWSHVLVAADAGTATAAKAATAEAAAMPIWR